MILVTGCAGFIGSHFVKRLISDKVQVLGIDLPTSQHKPIQKHRLKDIKEFIKNTKSSKLFTFKEVDISKEKELEMLFSNSRIEQVVHLAGSAGIKESSINPKKYVTNNIIGFNNLIQKCKYYKISKLIYASSSSVYNNKQSVNLNDENSITDLPINIYAYTKKTNELLAHTYSHLFGLNSIGLRFFSVYGPFGRPDMSYYKFTKAILDNQIVYLNNKGKNIRDFTYIDDVVTGIHKILFSKNKAMHNVYNIGSGNPVKIIDILKKIKLITKKDCKIVNKKPQKEDAFKTGSNSTNIKQEFKVEFKTDIDTGLIKFINWYKDYTK